MKGGSKNKGSNKRGNNKKGTKSKAGSRQKAKKTNVPVMGVCDLSQRLYSTMEKHREVILYVIYWFCDAYGHHIDTVVCVSRILVYILLA